MFTQQGYSLTDSSMPFPPHTNSCETIYFGINGENKNSGTHTILLSFDLRHAFCPYLRYRMLFRPP